jgi:hypothetical protein
MKKRYIEKQIKNDLARKMVFLAGPRQVGKTTLAKKILPDKRGYLSWDITGHRNMILKNELPPVNFFVFDEIHKYKRWRNFLKDVYDNIGDKSKILVTGSAKLNQYRYGGDSLQGRYHFLRMYPLTVAELGISNQKELFELLTLGGFPEPYFSSSKKEAKRWSREYRTLLINEEVDSLEHILDLGTLELLSIRLPDLVGSPLSINSLREDLQTSHKTISNWLNIFERLYAIFRLKPFGSPLLRAVKKEQKHYHFDWTFIPDEAIKFENLVALHLLKWVYYLQDTEGKEIDLCYFRDIDGREVDFVITEDRKPILFIEVKWQDREVSKSLKYLHNKYKDTKALQISAIGTKDYLTKEGIRVLPALQFLKKLS